jgi:hypothetical protein
MFLRSHLSRPPYRIVNHLDLARAANLATHHIGPLRHPTQPIDRVQECSAFDASKLKLGAESEYYPRKFRPVILNSEEEIGWKVQPQNSKLWQEIV